MKLSSLIALVFMLAIAALAQQPVRPTTAPRTVAWTRYDARTPALMPESVFTGAKIRGDLITLERTVCFGTCPIYSVTIASDGQVTFEGRQYTKVTGIARGKISQKKFRQLVTQFQQMDYFSLPNDFSPGTKVCPQMVTDMPSAITSIRLKGKSKTVSHYHGCGNSGALAQLTALENKIDEVAETQRWIK